MINATTHFAFRIHIDGFPMTVVASDSEPVIPLEVQEVILNAAERFDVLITVPNNVEEGDRFWIRADTLESTKQGYQNGITAILSVTSPETVDSNIDGSSILDPSEPIESLMRTTERLTLNCYSKHETDNAVNNGGCLSITDLQYDKETSEVLAGRRLISDEPSEVHTVDFQFSTPPKLAHFVRIDKGKYIQHVNPKFTMLSSDFDPSKDMHPSSAVLHVPAQSNIITVWRNKSLVHHPMHLHGLKMEVLDIHIPDKVKDCSLENCRLPTIYESTEALKLLDNIPHHQAVLKDTVLMPAGGAVVTRIRTGDPALWFIHCHLELHRENGMALILNVGNYSSPEDGTWLPDDYPNCGTPFLQSRTEFLSCPCDIHEDAVLDTAPKENHVCSRVHLCDSIDSLSSNAETYAEFGGDSLRSHYQMDNWMMSLIFILMVTATFVILPCNRSRHSKGGGGDKEAIDITSSDRSERGGSREEEKALLPKRGQVS